MRKVAAFALIAICIVGAAWAQGRGTEPPPPVTHPVVLFDMQPNGQDYARNYPRAALDSGHPGIGVICCRPRADRTLDCTVPLAWPANQGFEQATLAISREFRVHEDSYAYLQEHPEALPVRRLILWTMRGEQHPVFEQVRERIRENLPNLCPSDAAIEPVG